MTQDAAIQPSWDRLQRGALLVGVIGLALCLLGGYLNPLQFFRSYLLAYVFWIDLSLGCLPILMLHHLVGGAWGAVIRRTLEAATRTLPLMALLFVPLLFGLDYLYSWARPEVVAADEILQHKRPYLNTTFFIIRAAIYFVVWLTLMYGLNTWSQAQDRAATDPYGRRLRLLSGAGLVLYVLTVTFASVDWMMSLEPHWFSTIYGVLVIVGQVLASLAFVVIITNRLADVPPLSEVISPTHFLDLGNLLFAFVMLWAYMAISQFLVIWSGNLPMEITWYIHRMQGGWGYLGLMMALFYFALPFLLLLSRHIKLRSHLLVRVAAGILIMHAVERFWFVVPAFHPTGITIHWLDIVSGLGLGGLWFAVFLWQLKGRPFLPVRDPGLEGVMRHG